MHSKGKKRHMADAFEAARRARSRARRSRTNDAGENRSPASGESASKPVESESFVRYLLQTMRRSGKK